MAGIIGGQTQTQHAIKKNLAFKKMSNIFINGLYPSILGCGDGVYFFNKIQHMNNRFS